MPGMTAHLRSCPRCADDYAGLINALMSAEAVAAGTSLLPLGRGRVLRPT